jgi:hypothetical protein
LALNIPQLFKNVMMTNIIGFIDIISSLIFLIVTLFFFFISLILFWFLRKLHLFPQLNAKHPFLTSLKFISFLFTIPLLIIFLSVINSFLGIRIFPPPLVDRIGKYISWNETIKLFEDCKIESYGFTHSGGTSIRLKDGRTLYTERKQWSVVGEIETKYQNKCGQVESWIE